MEERDSVDVERSAYRDWLRSMDDQFRFAKTYADGAPHEYIWRDWNSVSVDMLESFTVFIREHGRDETYYGDHYTVIDIDGYKYWTMGADIEDTNILNRRSYDGYDIIKELEDMGEDPSEYVDTDEYERGELYHPAEKNPES